MASYPPIEIDRERVRPLRRVEYDRLVEMGVFDQERIELLYGVLVRKAVSDPKHQDAIDQLTAIFVPPAAGRFVVRVQGAFAASEYSEPEPDLSLLPVRDYSREHPEVAFLAIEVANSSLRFDRRVKAALYAEVGIPEYWIFDVVHAQVEIHRDPHDGTYRDKTVHSREETIAPAAFPDVVVRIADVIRG